MVQRNGSGMPGGAGRARRRVAAAAVALLAAAAVLAGAGPAAAKPNPPVLAFTPSPYDYGQVTTGESAVQRFRLTNSGGKATGKLKVTLSGAAAFTITRDRCSGTKLRPGKSCVVRVRFAPTSAGSVIATLTAADKKGVSATVALSGTGAGLGGTPPGHLYWTNHDAGTINVADLNGTNRRVLVTGQDNVTGVAVDASHLYWSHDGPPGTINRADLDGSNVQVIVSDQFVSWGVAVDASHLYWTAPSDAIMQANLDGTNPQAIVTDQDVPFGVAVDPNFLYWANAEGGTINVANLDGTDPQEGIIFGQDNPAAVAVDASHLYWTNTGTGGPTGTINVADLDGRPPGGLPIPRVLVSGQNSPVGMAVSSTHLYWTNPNGGVVNWANLDGTGAAALFSDPGGPFGIAVGP